MHGYKEWQLSLATALRCLHAEYRNLGFWPGGALPASRASPASDAPSSLLLVYYTVSMVVDRWWSHLPAGQRLSTQPRVTEIDIDYGPS